ncbi:MAG: hypothetical protein ABSD02_23880 [Steroidobacteraceae bacterium]|jgi:hypothetical protein
MVPNRRLSLTLILLVCFSTALASAYENDQLESRLPPSSPYSPLLFSALLSNFAGHVRLGNDPVTAHSPDLAFNRASLASPKEVFQADTMLTLPGTNCRVPGSHNSVALDFGVRNSDAWDRVLTVTYDLEPSPASEKLMPATPPHQETALVVDEFPCLPIPSLHSLSTPFRSSLFTPDSIGTTD